MKAIRRDLFDQYLHLPAARHDRESSGRLLSRLTYTTASRWPKPRPMPWWSCVRDSLAILGLLIYMFWMSWSFTLLALVAAPVLGWVLSGINARFRRHSARIQQSMGDVTRVAKEALEAQRTIKTSGAEAQQLKRFEAVNEHNRHSQERLLRVRAASSPVVQFIAALGLAAVLRVCVDAGGVDAGAGQ